jgi:ankyrin repeat protein
MADTIFEAIQEGDAERAAQIIAADPASARERNAAGVSAILQARYYGQLAIVSLLRKHAGELDIFESSALGDIPQLKKLLQADPARIGSYSPDGFTPLHLAGFFSQPEAVAELLRSGADADAVATNGSRLAVINSAAASRNSGIVKLILAAGANPNTQQHGGYTALHAAAQHNDREMIGALLDAGADPSIRTDEGKLAAEMANPDVAAMLLPR